MKVPRNTVPVGRMWFTHRHRFPAGFLIRKRIPAYRDPTMPVHGSRPALRRPVNMVRLLALGRQAADRSGTFGKRL